MVSVLLSGNDSCCDDMGGRGGGGGFDVWLGEAVGVRHGILKWARWVGGGFSVLEEEINGKIELSLGEDFLLDEAVPSTSHSLVSLSKFFFNSISFSLFYFSGLTQVLLFFII